MWRHDILSTLIPRTVFLFIVYKVYSYIHIVYYIFNGYSIMTHWFYLIYVTRCPSSSSVGRSIGGADVICFRLCFIVFGVLYNIILYILRKATVMLSVVLLLLWLLLLLFMMMMMMRPRSNFFHYCYSLVLIFNHQQRNENYVLRCGFFLVSEKSVRIIHFFMAWRKIS